MNHPADILYFRQIGRHDLQSRAEEAAAYEIASDLIEGKAVKVTVHWQQGDGARHYYGG